MIKRSPIAYFFAAYFFLATVLLSGCVSAGGKSGCCIVDALTSNANVEAMMLFAALSDGARKSRFAQYREQYSRLIGALEALEMEARVRHTPETDKGAADPSGSPLELIQGMLRTITGMRDTHAAVGLTATEIGSMRQDWVTYMNQALAQGIEGSRNGAFPTL